MNRTTYVWPRRFWLLQNGYHIADDGSKSIYVNENCISISSLSLSLSLSAASVVVVVVVSLWLPLSVLLLLLLLLSSSPLFLYHCCYYHCHYDYHQHPPPPYYHYHYQYYLYHYLHHNYHNKCKFPSIITMIIITDESSGPYIRPIIKPMMHAYQTDSIEIRPTKKNNATYRILWDIT